MKNIYELLNDELLRMHVLLHKAMYDGSKTNNAATLYERIMTMQNTILQMAKGSDAEIQKAIAEMAFTGSKDEETKPT